MKPLSRRSLALALASAAFAGNRGHAQNAAVLIFAAASVKNALDAVLTSFREKHGVTAVASYGASSALARQIENGAPADVFLSADLDWMDYLQTRKLINPASRSNLLTNRLALIAPRESAVALQIVPGFALAGALRGGRLAVADVRAVPAGKYGKAALEALGVWPSVEGRLASSENVRAALMLVALGEAPLGIVYSSDAVAEPRVKVIGLFPQNTHPPIVYPVALTAETRKDGGRVFLEWLRAPQSRAEFEKAGFSFPA